MHPERGQPGVPVGDEPDGAALGAMVESLSSISSDLLQSYERLAARAERADKELCKSNRELEAKVAEVEAILETLPVGVVVRDEDGRVLRVNGALCRILGREARELLGTPTAEVLPRHDAESRTVDYVGGDGSGHVLASHASRIVSETGAGCGSIEVFDDRTELNELTQRVHQMDKMAALGNMAAGIAHEIRNPMNAVKGFADLFQRKLDPDSEHQRWARLISEGVREVDSIITSLLSFSQPEQLGIETLETGALVEDAIAAALQRTPGGRAAEAWTITRDCEPLVLRGDRIKLRQALRNLVSNALEVQPEGGALEVSVSEVEGDVLFAVGDAGPGVPTEIAGRLTDPFFTTRAEGTGLGLSLVHTIVRLHGGALEVLDTPSPLGGAQIQFRLPKNPQR